MNQMRCCREEGGGERRRGEGRGEEGKQNGDGEEEERWEEGGVFRENLWG
jgi:hypothetical protein